jgi:hypothetical protein
MNGDERKEYRCKVAEHRRTIAVTMSRYSHALWLHLGEFPLLTKIFLGQINQLPTVYRLLDDLRHAAFNLGDVTLPTGSKVVASRVRDETKWNSQETPIFVFKPSSSHYTANSPADIALTEDDMESLIGVLWNLWDANKDMLLAYYPYNKHPEMAEPPFRDALQPEPTHNE